MGQIKALVKMFVLPKGFPNPKVEREFLKTYNKIFAPQRRATMVIAFGLWCLYLGWDFFHFYNHQEMREISVSAFVFSLRCFGIYGRFQG
jgi:hypothetical protein